MNLISGIQQIGIGITDVYQSWEWYKNNLGFNVPIVDDSGWAKLMLPYTNGNPQQRHAIMALNMQGGGAFEVWQYVSRKPVKSNKEIKAGDLGIYITKLKTLNIEESFEDLKSKGVNICGNIHKSPFDRDYFYFKDPYGNIFQMVESDFVFKKTNYKNGGVYGAIIGVSDMQRSIKFYKNILGYDKIIFDDIGVFDDLKYLPNGDAKFRRVLLTHKEDRKGPFGRLLGKSEIELISLVDGKGKKIYKNRLWGDLGFIHICFDIVDMDKVKEICEENGYPFTVDSNPRHKEENDSFDMGEATGRFSYIEDPDGTLIEFVETHKIPIIKKIGWYIDLKKRNPEKPLPNFMLKMLDIGFK